MRVPIEVGDALASYVYVYIDPRNGQPFYVGKGKGNRLFSHLDDQTESEKVRRIAELRAAGLEPQIDVLRYGLSDPEAGLVEAAAIDLIGRPPLTNIMAGHHAQSFGRVTSQEVIAMLTAKPVVVRERALLITINQLYRSGMSPQELYEATRGFWVVGPRREKAELALAVYQGVVREVYRIRAWHPAATLEYATRDAEANRGSRRWEFEGDIAEDVREDYVGRSVGKGGQNPIRYVNV
ncbi:MAG: hypothetical protein ABSD62_11935 [Candidatus Limnocylindrales bacterium]|jgi:hypothetical protein